MHTKYNTISEEFLLILWEMKPRGNEADLQMELCNHPNRPRMGKILPQNRV